MSKNSENVTSVKPGKATKVKSSKKETIVWESNVSNVSNETETGLVDAGVEEVDEEKFPICLDKIYRVLGYKEKRLVIKLLNGKYNFVENEDYMTKEGNTYITPECFKLLCFLSRTEQGDKFRRLVTKKMISFCRYENIDLNEEILPIPDVHFENLDVYDNKKIFYVINIKDDLYIYGITTDIGMLVSLLKNTYTIIINKFWLLDEKIQADKLLGECKGLVVEEKNPKLKSSFRCNDIYSLLVKFNDIIKSL
jgi:hypothetical protein